MERQSQNVVLHRGRPILTGKDVANAKDYFEHFLNATSLRHILGYYRNICEVLNLKPNLFPLFYPKLRNHITSWKAKALWKKIDQRALHKCYGKGKICSNSRVLIIGAGPCGLRTAIEAQLLGAKVVVIEKRDRLSRNNVLHLWPFIIEDLRALGAKKFFGKFCAGAIDHISIRQLQCILLKVALLLGVEVHTEVSFERLIEPNKTEKTGWKAEFKPIDHPVSQYEFDVIIGADGKRNTLQGFKRKEFRGKLAIAITANFINKRTEAEARVEEISGVAFIFNQKFFKELYEATGIDLENIVYYKDDTHYFVMTAKKTSLIEKGVIKQDLADTERLLGVDNVNRDKLMNYAREAANFSTNYQMPDLNFAVNHYGQPDVAMFDFTSMYAAENASKIIERNGYRLLMILVGDSLLEPFWPTGSGCARGFLSSMDAAWAIRSWCIGTMTPLEVIAERESIYRLLAQTTPDNLNKDWKAYTLDPTTRYPNLNKNFVIPLQATSLFDTDNVNYIEEMRNSIDKSKKIEIPKKRRRENVDNEILFNWISEQIKEYNDIHLNDFATIFKDGKILCAILHHYRPDLIDYSTIKNDEPTKNNQLAIDILDKDIGIPPIMTAEEITNTEDYLTMATYLTQIYDYFRGEIPHIKHPKLELPPSSTNESTITNTKNFIPDYKNYINYQFSEVIPLSTASQIRPSSRHKRHAGDGLHFSSNKANSMEKKTRKRRTLEKTGASIDHENKVPNISRSGGGGNTDEDLAARIKSLEDKWKEPQPTDKKPKDLMRAIGKIETSDWNIKEIEKKIRENKLGKSSAANKDKEKVPKWSKEQFVARQTKMEKQHLDRQDSAEVKYAVIDKNIKHLELRLKEGTTRDLGQNKVATITEKLTSKIPTDNEVKSIQKSSSRPAIILPIQGGSEFCHFCGKRVYLMERLSAEGRFFHHGCFKCQFCNTQLRLGSYAFDRDGLYGHKFFCIHHFGMQGEAKTTKITRKITQKAKSPEKRILSSVTGVDLLDRVRTPERVEFANLSMGNASSEQDESLSQMDEDEWTDKNFGASAAELGSSDDEDSSSISDSDDSQEEDAYEEALEEPATKEGTLKWAERFNKRYSKKKTEESDSDEYSSSDQSSYYENSTDDEESETATEGEEEIRARELRKQEVCVEPPVVQTDTGTDTEIVSDESSSESSSSKLLNSATEVSTDSEFAQDDPTPTREIPAILLNDFHVTKTRGSNRNHAPKKIQITTGYIEKGINKKKQLKQDIELKLSPLVPSSIPSTTPSITSRNKMTALPLLPRNEGYALNRTQSTGGIAAKVSLELKKKYLLGETNVPGNIQKSGSASTLDTKLKSFHSNISDCQKLLKPAGEISPSMQTFCNKLNEQRLSPVLTSQINTTKSMENIEKEKSLSSSPSILNKTEKEILKKNEEEKQIKIESNEADIYTYENEPEGRPRSPVHETSIIVPNIDWTKANQNQSSDSLTDDELILTGDGEDEEDINMKKDKLINFQFENIPIVKIDNIIDQQTLNNDNIQLDSLCVNVETKKNEITDNNITSINSEILKSITSDKKTLNQPKSLPNWESSKILTNIHSSIHNNKLKNNENDDINKKDFQENHIKSIKTSSEHSISSSNNGDSIAEQGTTAALTETELSDWARDENVLDDLEDEQFDINLDTSRSNKKPKQMYVNDKYNTNLTHICGKDNKELKNKIIITEATNNALSKNLDNIEFMDTGTETSSDDNGLTGNSQNGYILFKDDDDDDDDGIIEDSLNPNINNSEYEIKNTGYCIIDNELPLQLTTSKNFGGEVIDLKPYDIEKFKLKQNNLIDNEEDSLLIIETNTGTTTEENTISDSTVKNVTELSIDKSVLTPTNESINNNNNNQHRQRLEEKLAKLKSEQHSICKQLQDDTKNKPNECQFVDNNLEFEEHCQRLQSKIEFGNVKDSIDIRKSRRKSKCDSPINYKPDLIQEEKEINNSFIDVPIDLTIAATSTTTNTTVTSIIRTPDILYNKEVIEKERDVNQKLVQEMVMNKMKAENKSLERKRRSRNLSINKSNDLFKSPTVDDIMRPTPFNNNNNRINSNIPPDVLLSSNIIPLQKSQTVNTIITDDSFKTQQQQQEKEKKRPFSVYSTFSDGKKFILPFTQLTNPDNCSSLSDLRTIQLINNDNYQTPTRQQKFGEEIKRTSEKLKQEARNRLRLLTNEELGLSPEEKLYKLKEKMLIKQRDKENENNKIINLDIQESIESLVMNTERRNSWLYSNDTLNRKKNSFRRSQSGESSINHFNNNNNQKNNRTIVDSSLALRTKSISEISNKTNLTISPSTTAAATALKNQEKDSKKICKSDPNLLVTTNDDGKKKKKCKDRERRKSITKLFTTLFSKKTPSPNSKGLFSRISSKTKEISKDKMPEEPLRRNSFSEILSQRLLIENNSPPPVPPLPLHYTGSSIKGTDDSCSEGEQDVKKLNNRSSCDTIDQSGVLDASLCSLNSKKSSKGVKRTARQTQLKRHRMAQEIQRKLEETEVKTRELEERGVYVEKALRGEDNEHYTRDDCDLLQEWFDLMRDRAELRRYERELMVRAQELELEDRHARLQHELRERLENDNDKTQEDVEIEGSIINNMMEIVAKRDSLIALLEEDRLRYSNEDRDLEEQMLAKGLRLTPIRKTPEQ